MKPVLRLLCILSAFAWPSLAFAQPAVPYSANVQMPTFVTPSGGNTFFANGIAVTSTDGLILANTTDATGAVTVQMSPRLRWVGNAWDTAASETVAFYAEVLPATAATPTGTWNLKYSLNGGASTTPFSVTSAGTAAATTLSATTTVTADFRFTSRMQGTGSVTLLSNTAPTVSSGFGTSPTIPNSNTTAAFTVNVGTGGTATSGVLTMPAATTGWNCWVNNLTATAAHIADRMTRQTASTTTSVTLENQIVSTGATVGAPWAASDILRLSCFAY